MSSGGAAVATSTRRHQDGARPVPTMPPRPAKSGPDYDALREDLKRHPELKADLKEVRHGRQLIHSGGQTFGSATSPREKHIENLLRIWLVQKGEDPSKCTLSTRELLMKFQEENRDICTMQNGVAADGICGPRTWRAFERMLKNSAPGLETEKKEILKSIYGSDWEDISDEQFQKMLETYRSVSPGTHCRHQHGSVTEEELAKYKFDPKCGNIFATVEDIRKAYPSLSVEEAQNIRAMLGLISRAEGTSHRAGYHTFYGGETTDTLAKHPRIIHTPPGKIGSQAFGKYQWMPPTWDGVGGGPMDPLSQDLGAIRLIKSVPGAFEAVKSGNVETSLKLLAGQWASLSRHKGDTGVYNTPGYGNQRAKDFNQLVGWYGALKQNQGGG